MNREALVMLLNHLRTSPPTVQDGARHGGNGGSGGGDFGIQGRCYNHLCICTWAEQQLSPLMLTPLMTPLFLPLPSLFTDLFGGSVPRAYMSAPILVNYCNNWAGIWPPSICKVLFVEQIDIPRGNLFV